MSKDPPVEEYLNNPPVDIQAITRELVAVACKHMPGAYKLIYARGK